MKRHLILEVFREIGCQGRFCLLTRRCRSDTRARGALSHGLRDCRLYESTACNRSCAAARALTPPDRARMRRSAAPAQPIVHQHERIAVDYSRWRHDPIHRRTPDARPPRTPQDRSEHRPATMVWQERAPRPTEHHASTRPRHALRAQEQRHAMLGTIRGPRNPVHFRVAHFNYRRRIFCDMKPSKNRPNHALHRCTYGADQVLIAFCRDSKMYALDSCSISVAYCHGWEALDKARRLLHHKTVRRGVLAPDPICQQKRTAGKKCTVGLKYMKLLTK